MQYFDATNNAWLAGYCHDAFFFTTAAAAQYHARWGDARIARNHIEWMIKNANVYGLMPERIFLNQMDCSPASPLSWCCAEFVAALLAWSER
jgi:GH15 family glucan-1,4-alpha-glucosidase